MTATPWPDEFQLPPVGPYGWDALTTDLPPNHAWLDMHLVRDDGVRYVLNPDGSVAASGRNDHDVFADNGSTDTQ